MARRPARCGDFWATASGPQTFARTPRVSLSSWGAVRPRSSRCWTAGCRTVCLALRRSPPFDERSAGVPATADRLEAFIRELDTSGRSFNFDDCSVGNLVFAGCFLRNGRQFNSAVDDYCALVGLPAGVVENVTDGSNAYLVALGEGGGVLGSEEEIVGALGQNRIQEIYLIDRPLSEADRGQLKQGDTRGVVAFFESHRAEVAINPRLAEQAR